MQDIGIRANREVVVNRPEGSSTVWLEFRGLRDAPHVSDKDTRVRVAMPVARAAELRRQLTRVVPHDLEWQPAILDLLEQHQGEQFLGEDAYEMVKRLSEFWRQHHPAG